MKIRQLIVIVGLIFMTIFAVSAQETDEDIDYTLIQPEIDTENFVSYVYFAHTSVDTEPIDIYYANQSEPVVTNLAFGETTGAIRINSGNQLFTMRPAGSGADGDILTQMEWDYGGNTTWVVSAVGEQATGSLLFEPISVLRNNYDDMARIRVVNYVPDAVRSTVVTNDDIVLADNVGWIGMGDTMVEPNDYTLTATLDNDGTVEDFALPVEANTTYTIFVVGRGTSELPAQLLVFESEANTAHVQFVHDGSQDVDIHYRPSDERLVEGLVAENTSDTYDLESGSYTFISYLPDTGPTGQEQASIALELYPYYEYVISVTDSSMEIVEETLLPIDDDMSDDEMETDAEETEDESDNED